MKTLLIVIIIILIGQATVRELHFKTLQIRHEISVLKIEKVEIKLDRLLQKEGLLSDDELSKKLRRQENE